MSNHALLTEFRLGRMTLPNRMAMAPLTRNRAVENNTPNDLMAQYYVQRAGAGLIISEATQIMPEGLGYPNTPGIYSKEQIAGWKKITSAVHQAGGRMFLQLWHVGRISHPLLQPNGALPVAPSAIAPAGQVYTPEGMKPYVTPRALTLEEIPGIVATYRQAALNAVEAGFDGVEVHAANGYLIDQFLRDRTNHRTDAYGGSLENRARFLLEVTRSVIDAIGADRVGVRLSPGGTFNDMGDSNSLATFSYAMTQLDRLGVVYVHLRECTAQDLRHGGEAVPTAALRALYHGKLMVNAEYTLERADAGIDSGLADLVAFGVPYIANPDLVYRFQNGLPLNKADQRTFYGGGAKGYTDYPVVATPQPS